MADETQSSTGIPLGAPWGSAPGLALAFDTFPDGSRSLVFVGPGLADLVGRKAAEAINQDVGRLIELIHPEERIAFERLAHSGVDSDRSCHREYRLRTESGGFRWVHAAARMTRLDDGSIRWHGVLTDAVLRRRAIEKLCAGSSQCAAVTDAVSAFVQDGNWRQASAGILRCALEQTDSEYGFVGVVVAGPTLRVLAHQGIEWDAVVGREFYDAAQETYQRTGYLEFPNLKNLLGSVVLKGDPVISNNPSTDSRSGGLPPGHPPLRSFLGVPLRNANRVNGMIGMANRTGGYTGSERDKIQILCEATSVLYDTYRRRKRETLPAQERKQTEDALRFTQFAVDRAGEGAFWIHRDARFTYVNDTACRSLGYTREELVSMHVYDIDPDVPASKWLDIWSSLTQHGFLTFESHHRRKDGTTFPIEITANLLSYDGIDYCCAFVRDITERKRAEEELTHAIETAENASRAKSVFLANMSHEIRTPIMAMLGAAELMGTASSHETERVHRRNVILRNGRHLVSLIDNLLDTARMEAGRLDIHPIRCSLPEIVADVLAATAALNRSHRVDYRFCYETAIPASIRTDSTRLKQALINLINNALKFTETGHVRVSVRVDRDAPDPRLSISVEDTGPGIPDASLARIFETFAQLDPAVDEISRGVGLGLPLAKGIAEQLGGDLHVVSAIGKGSTFTLRVATGPLDAVEWIEADDTTTLPSRASDRSDSEAQQRLRGRVLLGEDFRDTRELVQHALALAGADVTAVAHGQRAIEVASEKSFDLILLDIRMPVLDGLSAAAELRRRGCKSPIIAMTATAAPEEHHRILEAGFDDIWPKPISLDQIVEQAGAYLESARADPEPLADNPPPRPRSKGSEARRTAIAEEFVTDLASRVRRIRHAVETGDAKAAREMLHQLVGAGGIHGFMSISHEAARLLGMTKTGALSAHPNELRALETMSREITDSLSTRLDVNQGLSGET